MPIMFKLNSSFIVLYLILLLMAGCIKDNTPTPRQDVNSNFVVVSMGKGLNDYGKSIQQTLYGLSKPYLNSTLPFTLLKSKPRGVENTFPNWNSITNKKLLWKKIHAIRFGFSLDALKALEFIEVAYSGSFKRILYLTDNGNMDDYIAPLLFNVPKQWQNDKIEFYVLTTASCHIWNKKAYATQCSELRGQGDIEKVLENFITEKPRIMVF
jgi:hypothetical protein